MQLAVVLRRSAAYHRDVQRIQRCSGGCLYVQEEQFCASLDGVGHSSHSFTIQGGQNRLLGSGLAGAKMATSGRFLLVSSRLRACVGASAYEGAFGSKS